LLDMLHPLQRLAAAGVAVLVLHHPRKKASEEGSSARGSGALLGFVDIILELHRVGQLQSDERRRRLFGVSRHPATPGHVVYQWLNRATEGKLVRRCGTGRRSDPYRYRLPNADDEYWDRGELPPLRGLLGA